MYLFVDHKITIYRRQGNDPPSGLSRRVDGKTQGAIAKTQEGILPGQALHNPHHQSPGLLNTAHVGETDHFEQTGNGAFTDFCSSGVQYPALKFSRSQLQGPVWQPKLTQITWFSRLGLKWGKI